MTGDAQELLAEIMRLPEGGYDGIGGSHHLAVPDFESNCVRGGIVPAAGIAMSYWLDDSDAISGVLIGDGTLGEGPCIGRSTSRRCRTCPYSWSSRTTAGRRAPRPTSISPAASAGDSRPSARRWRSSIRPMSSRSLRSLGVRWSMCDRSAAPALIPHTSACATTPRTTTIAPVTRSRPRWAIKPLAVLPARPRGPAGSTPRSKGRLTPTSRGRSTSSSRS